MPEIIISAAGASTPGHERDVMLLRERINASDFESERFAANLIERIEWAVNDAADLERRGRITGRPIPAEAELEPEPQRAPEPQRDRWPEPAGIA